MQRRARSLTVSKLAAPPPLALPTVLKHIGVLERAELVCRQKIGRTVNVTLAPEAMAWLECTEAFWTSRLDRLATVLQPAAAARPSQPSKSSPRPKPKEPSS